MTLRRVFKVKDRNSTVWWRSGHIYSFRYRNFENDPNPIVLCLYAIKGVNPNTRHNWNLVQAINLNYIPRHNRRKFLQTWISVLEKNGGNIRLTWEMLVRHYPYLLLACRRYLLDRKMFADLREIPLEDIESIVISSWAKDYSKQVQLAILRKYKNMNKYLKQVLISSLVGLRPPGPYYRKESD